MYDCVDTAFLRDSPCDIKLRLPNVHKVGEAAVAGARPLSQNAYKVPLTRNLVRRTIGELAAQA